MVRMTLRDGSCVAGVRRVVRGSSGYPVEPLKDLLLPGA